MLRRRWISSSEVGDPRSQTKLRHISTNTREPLVRLGLDGTLRMIPLFTSPVVKKTRLTYLLQSSILGDPFEMQMVSNGK